MKNAVTVACAVVAVGIGAGAAFVTTTNAAPAAAGGGTVPVTITGSSCGPSAGWHLAAGPVTFDVTSRASGYSSLYLVNTANDVLAEIVSQGSGPGAPAQPMPATLTGGTYTLRCVLTNAAVTVSGPVRVTGTAQGATVGTRPMTDLALEAAVRTYSAYVEARLPVLLAACQRLDADVARGDRTAARTDWLTAHLDYERLGAAYTAFGTFDTRIDGMATGLPAGPATPGWTGFFAVEHALWSGEPAAKVRPVTAGLVSAVAGLIADFPSEEIDPGDLPLRTHEILENALEFQLTGIADYGSGTTLATTYANAQGTAEILGLLAPVLRPLAPSVLASARQRLATLQKGLLAQRAPDGRWTPAASLPAATRERLDSELGSLLETLSQVPGVLTPRDGA